ncbi:MAG: hypothetical protein DI551_00305 [Micavibrio aeruginosavorus]|uniref:Uncharacterized protein n=1 Tax=Micavibrio aeruginosavorus TaxID=349221 RepID=A0A2W5PWB8_9BACT|nr:MAG: hypothetical protein DI551_00305 [Micavibrio aeruginosavorus]
MNLPTFTKKSRNVAISLFLALLFCGSGIFTFTAVVRNSVQKTPFLTFSDVPPQSRIETILTEKGRATALQSGNIDALPAPSFPYRLSSAIQLPAGDYRDIILTVTDQTPALTVLVDGFKMEDSVSLTLNGEKAYTLMSFDWSGRLELEAPLPMGPVEACVEILGRTEILGMCHTIQDRGAA